VCTLTVEGTHQGAGISPLLGSLLVGYYDRGRLVFAGGVGTGFSVPERRKLVAKLQGLRRNSSPFVEVPRADARDARWVEPKLVAEVEFTSWTRDGPVRHPSFRGLRENKPAREVRLEGRLR
jgi:bifunctional non-homologous end joining protein LigD